MKFVLNGLLDDRYPVLIITITNIIISSSGSSSTSAAATAPEQRQRFLLRPTLGFRRDNELLENLRCSGFSALLRDGDGRND